MGPGERHPGDELNILGGAFAEHEPAQRPIDDPDAIEIARAEDEVRVLGRLEEHGDIVGVMGKIAIQLEDEFVTVFQGPFEAGDVSAAKAVLFGAMQDVNGVVPRGQFIRDLAGAVRGVVIHHQHIDLDWQGEKAFGERRKVFPLVKRRHHYKSFVHANEPPTT